jgi:centromere/kinetochore protein ZW10
MNGSQSFLQDTNTVERDQGIKDVVEHIRDKSTRWKKILPYSAWASAIGSLVNAVATNIISDVFDLSDIGVNDAEEIAQLIQTVTKLDNLFIDETSRKNGTTSSSGDHDDTIIYNTPRFADKWLKMKFLSEVLQSNLKDIRYLWFESELSLYFTKEETVDLITLSFEDNVNARGLIREIKASTKGQ